MSRLRPDFRSIRQKEATERNQAWAALSVREQLAALDRRLGKGLGAKKQRGALSARLQTSDPRHQSQK